MNRRSFRILVGATLALQLLLPLAAGAQDGNGNGNSNGNGNGVGSTRVRAAKTSNVCANIERVTGQVSEKWDERISRLSERRGASDEALGTRRTDREQGLANARMAQDERHSKRFELLLGKAATPEEKAAVQELQAAVEKALSDRRAAVDAAVTAYRSGVDAAVVARRTTVDSAVTKLKASIDAAVAAAKTACAAEGADGVAVRQQLNEAITTARTQYQTDVDSVQSFRDTVDGLLETRDGAFRAAWEQFKADVEAARDAFKAKIQALRPAPTDTGTTSGE